MATKPANPFSKQTEPAPAPPLVTAERPSPAANLNDLVDKREEFIIGQPKSSFLPHELVFVNEELTAYAQLLKEVPAAKLYVWEMIKTALEIDRHDIRVGADLTAAADKQSDGYLVKMQRNDKARQTMMDRYGRAQQALGVMPKDQLANRRDQDQAEEPLTLMHKRYIAEVTRRKGLGEPIGAPSAEARQLAHSVGMDVSTYSSAGGLTPTLRTEVVNKLDDEVRQRDMMRGNNGR